MIDPSKIPQFTGNLDQLESDAAGLRTDASNIRNTGRDTNAAFQGLSAFYHAPEAEQLFATTAPVKTKAASFADDLEKVATALDGYASEVKPIAQTLRHLQTEAQAFVASTAHDSNWKYDSSKVNHNNDLLRQVDAAVAAFWAAERTAANLIDALFGGTQYVGNDGSNKSNMYGYTASQLDGAKVPWGTSETQAHHWYDIGYWVKSFVWDGLIVDGVWGTIKGIGGLVGFEGWSTFVNSWKGIGELAVGLELDTTIVGLVPNSWLPQWAKDSRKMPLEFAKSLVAWDEWKKNPATAAGSVTFNILTCVVAPLKIGKLGALGDVADAAGDAGKASIALTTLKAAGTVGEVIDPMTYIGKALSPITSRLPSISELASKLGQLHGGGAGADIHGVTDLTHIDGTPLPDGALKLPDGSILHADGALHLPDGTVTHLTQPELAALHASHGGLDTTASATSHTAETVTHGGHDIPAQTDHGSSHAPSGAGGSHDSSGAAGRGHDAASSGGHPDHSPGNDSGHTGGADAVGAHEPAGQTLPDGSWEGKGGLHLTPTQNEAVDAYINHAASDEPHVTSEVQAVAHEAGHGELVGLEARLKGADSLKRKIASEMLRYPDLTVEEAAARIKDSVRYTLEVPADHYTTSVDQAVHGLESRGFENVTFKNTWDASGYKGINSTWRDPVTGRTFELQFHTPDSFAAKTVGHGLYEEARLPGVTPEEAARLEAEQESIFGRVHVPEGAGAIHLHPATVDGLDHSSVGASGHASTTGHDVSSGTTHGPPSEGSHDAGTPAHSGDQGITGHEGTNTSATPPAGHPTGGWSGASWVEKPTDSAAKAYELIRQTPNKVDLPQISEHTGISEQVLRQVKAHLFRAQHDVAYAPGAVRRGLFTPRDDIAQLWQGATKGTLSPADLNEFRSLMTHEYIESQLMKSGLPYISHDPAAWDLADGSKLSPPDLSLAGAHDLSPHPVTGSFRHWARLGLEPPAMKTADDLSNIDDIAKAVMQELRSKGVNLK